MTVRAKKVLADGLELPEKQRWDLAIQLLVSLDRDDSTPEEVEASWKAEISRRLDDMESGKVKMIPGDQFLKWLRGLCNETTPVRRPPARTNRHRRGRGLVRSA